MGRNYAANGEDAEMEMEPMMGTAAANSSNKDGGPPAAEKRGSKAKKHSINAPPERDKWSKININKIIIK